MGITGNFSSTKFSMGKWAWWLDQNNLAFENLSCIENSSLFPKFLDCVRSQRHFMTLTKGKGLASEAVAYSEPDVIDLENRKLKCLFFHPSNVEQMYANCIKWNVWIASSVKASSQNTGNSPLFIPANWRGILTDKISEILLMKSSYYIMQSST